MRYGVLVVTPVSSERDRAFVNMGDAIQTEAILYLYEQMGIRREDVVRINLKDLNNYSGGGYVILPININLSLNWIVNVFPMSPYIIPVFLGLSYFAAEDFSRELADYFRRYAPIGCRDEFTLQLMRKNKIPAYLFGCVTAFLPYRDRKKSGTRNVFFVDVPESFEKYSKEHFEGYADAVRISHIRENENTGKSEYLEKAARDLLERYREEASLVVTSRLHCMAPCMAMGVPVIPVTDNISPRMSWIDYFLHIYTPETYGQIDWRGQTVSYEDQKRLMLDIAVKRVRDAWEQNSPMLKWSHVLETRVRSEYGNYYREILKNLPEQRRDKLEYILWGSGQIGINVYQVISRLYPDSRLVAAVDSYCEGTFFGVPIEKPDILKTRKQAYVFITTTSGEACAREYLASLGKTETRDFLCMATTAG